MPVYHIPNQLPPNYQLMTIFTSKTEKNKETARSLLQQMQELCNHKTLLHRIYLSATLFFLIHMLRIAFYLGTLIASTTEIIQKAENLDFTEAELKSKSRIEIFAFNNIGKCSHGYDENFRKQTFIFS